jgi:hypothetical protein
MLHLATDWLVGFAFVDDCGFTMRVWQMCALLSSGFRAHPSRIPFQISCLGVPLAGGKLFSFLIGCPFDKLDVSSVLTLQIFLFLSYRNP